jgi:hypothetical protein
LLAVAAVLLTGVLFACNDAGDPAPTPAVDSTSTAVATEAPPPPSPAAPPATPAASPTVRPPPEAARPFPPELREQVQPLLQRAAEIRGTPPKHDVDMYLIGRRDAVALYRDDVKEEDERVLAVQQDVYRLLGMIPQTTDLKEAFLTLLGAGILGFYDPERRAFFLLDDIGGTDSLLSRLTIVHEFTHALQDQYIDIAAVDKARKHQWDANTAFTDVLEGDAVNSEVGLLGFNIRAAACFAIPPVTGTGALPYVIQRELTSWYDDGNCFIKNVTPRLERGLAAVFENLPTTTEQILHPERYVAGEKAKPVTPANLATALGEGWKETYRSDLGEFRLQNLLVVGLRNERPRVQRAAEGWGGDAWVLYARDATQLFHGAIAWDTPEDAQEFFRTLADSLRGRGANVQPASEAAFSAETEGKTWRAALTADRVTLVVSTDATAVDRAAQSLGLP